MYVGSFVSLRNLCVLGVSCGFRLNLHNRRGAEDAEVAQRLEPVGKSKILDSAHGPEI